MKRCGMSQKRRISLTLDEKEYAEISNLSEKHQISMAWICRQAINRFLEKSRNGDVQLPLPLLSKSDKGMK